VYRPGRVFVGHRNGRFYAVDAGTGTLANEGQGIVEGGRESQRNDKSPDADDRLWSMMQH
jgi:hypothetical protein